MAVGLETFWITFFCVPHTYTCSFSINNLFTKVTDGWARYSKVPVGNHRDCTSGIFTVQMTPKAKPAMSKH